MSVFPGRRVEEMVHDYINLVTLAGLLRIIDVEAFACRIF